MSAKSSKKQLSREQLKELKEVFQMFDKDGAGHIDTKKLGSILKQMGKKLGDKDIRKMIREADKDGSGTIDFPEFVQCMYKHMNTENNEEKELRDAFDLFDVNGDGHITFQELKGVLASMGEGMPDGEIEDMLFEADSNGDGVIDFSEFTNLMSSMNSR